MKKRILALLGLTSIALAASVISLDSSKHNVSEANPEIESTYDKEAPGAGIYAVPADLPPNGREYTINPTTTEVNNASIFLSHMNLGTLRTNYRGDTVKVGIIDSGVNYDHEDFYDSTGKYVISEDSAVFSGTNVTRIKNGTVVDYSLLDDTNGHGTNVASTLASQINGKGSLGVAPNVELVICKTNYQFNEMNNAIDYCVDVGVDIINLSVQSYITTVTYGSQTITGSGYTLPTLMKDSIDNAYAEGVTILAAGGNMGTSDPCYPANNNHVLAIGALARDSSTTKAGYSNTGTNVDVVGPGSVYVATTDSNSSYDETQGTSFACPAAVGVAALYKQMYPNASPDDVFNAFTSCAHHLGTQSGKNSDFGYGRIDATAMLAPPVYVETITPNPSSYKIKVGESTTIQYSVSPYNADDRGVLFMPDDSTIIDCDMETGEITGLKVGTTFVTIESNDGHASVDVPVEVISDEGTWDLVTSIDDISEGDVVVIGRSANSVVAGPISSNVMASVGATFDTTANQITSFSGDVLEFTLGKSGSNWTFTNNNELLKATDEKKLALGGNSGVGTWTISISGSADATIKCTTTSYGSIQYNTSSPRFTTYTSNQSTVQLYKYTTESGGTTTNYTVTFNSNGGTGTMTSKTTKGSTYTVPACTFTRTDHIFSKWALNSTSGQQYSVGSTITGISSDITLYAIWTEGGSGAQMDPHYYDDITSDLTGSDLLSALRTLNLEKRTRTISYDDMGTSPSGYYRYTDYDPATVQYDGNGQPYGTKILSFYSGISTTSWNREHVWPNSRGGGSGGNSGTPYVDQDIYMPRPTITEENSNRGNSKYVEGVVSTTAGWDPVAAFDSTIGTYSNIRGECARIIFYCMTVNSKLVLDDTATGGTTGVTMGKLSDLLKWNLNYPVNDREIRRQSGGQYLQGNRNAFVDDPSYACKIWGTYNSTTKQICGITDKTLSSIAVSNEKVSYTIGDSFQKPTVTATYADGTTGAVSGLATFDGYDLNSEGTQTVTVTYTLNGVTKTTTYQITVSTSGGDIPTEGAWVLCDSASDIEDGGYYMFVGSANNTNYYLPAVSSNTTSFSSTNTGTPIASTSNPLAVSFSDAAWKLTKSGTTYTISSSNNNSVKLNVSSSTVVANSSGGSWSIQKIDGTNEFSVSTSNRYLTSYSSSPYGFRAYSTLNQNGDSQLSIYKWNSSAGPTPEVTNISVDPTSMNLDLYGTYSKTLTATVTADDGADTTVSWESSDTSVATVSASTGNSITVTGLKVGDATITATAGEKTATCTVSVSDSMPRVTGITLDSTKTLDLNGGATGTLIPTVTKVGNPSYTISWSSSNSGVVEVDQSGNLNAKSTGSADITASISSTISATCKVTVEDSTPIVHDVTIDVDDIPTDIDVYSKPTSTVSVKITADPGAEYTVEWTSSDETVATVAGVVKTKATRAAASEIEAYAQITAVGPGTTTITASAGGQSTSFEVTIADSTPHATGVSLDITSKTLVINETVQLKETINPSDAVEKGVSWSSSNSDIASVTSNGLVTANAVGEATITVTTEDGGHTATCKITVITSSAAAIGEAKAWAIEFIQMTTTTSTCKAKTDEQRLSGLQAVWPELEASYDELSNEAKTAFCTNSDEKIKEALNHYQFIISKFNKNSNQLNDFVVDGNGNKPASSSRSMLSTMFSKENAGLTVVILSVVGLVAIGSFFVFRKRKTY